MNEREKAEAQLRNANERIDSLDRTVRAQQVIIGKLADAVTAQDVALKASKWAIERLGATVAALNHEQAAHGRLIIRLYKHNDELSGALRDGKEPPQPPRPEQARGEAQEIAELDAMMRPDHPPPEAV